MIVGVVVLLISRMRCEVYSDIRNVVDGMAEGVNRLRHFDLTFRSRNVATS
jgi:hypothetical protein